MATFDSKTIVMMAENGHSVEIDGKRIQMTIVTDAQTSEAKPDYSHLVGKWYKVLENSRIDKTLHGKHMKCFGLDKIDGTPLMGNDSFGIEYHSLSNTLSNVSGWTEPEQVFDLSNPLDHNPSEVRVFDVPSEIRISSYSKGFDLHFSEYQSLWYDTENNCYGVLTDGDDYTPIPCIATECKFEDLQEGDLFFSTDNEKLNFTSLRLYNFLNKHGRFVFTDGTNVNVLTEHKYNHYFKITAKP